MAGDAVIFIPGIKGTKLVETNRPTWDTIWSGIQMNFETLEDLELTRGYRGRYFEEKATTIIRPSEIETLAYGEFLRDLKTDGRPVYIFNYDWRLSAKDNGVHLADFMHYLIDKSKARYTPAQAKPRAPIQSFDIITHSLGNFVLRNYLHRHGFARINKIVLTVPPFRGSLDIVGAALIGEGFFPNVKAKVRKLIRTWPGALELLPSYPEASRFDTGAAHSFFRFTHWQSNVQNADERTRDKMKKILRLVKKVTQDELCDLSSLSSEQRQRILIIVRDGFDTWQSVPILRIGPGECRNFVDFERGPRTKDGDGRVPHVSSCCYCDTIRTFTLEDSIWFRDYSHGFVLKDERLQKLVNRFLFAEQFDPTIPGGSVKQVRALKEARDPESGLPYWTLETGT